MLTDNQHINDEENEGPSEAQNLPAFNFNDCYMIKKMTTHKYSIIYFSIYRLSLPNHSYIIKSFSLEAESNFSQEIACLSLMNHPNVPKIVFERKANL